MKTLLKVRNGAVLIGALVLLLFLRGCFHRPDDPGRPIMSTVFPSTDSVRVAIKDSTLEVQTPTSTQFKYVPEEGQAVVDIQKNGTPVIKVMNKGFTRQPGADIFFADKSRVGGDCEFAYWNRFGLHLGGGFGSQPLFVVFISGSYQLDQLHLNSTSVWVGYTSHKDIAIGLRTRL